VAGELAGSLTLESQVLIARGTGRAWPSNVAPWGTRWPWTRRQRSQARADLLGIFTNETDKEV